METFVRIMFLRFRYHLGYRRVVRGGGGQFGMETVLSYPAG